MSEIAVAAGQRVSGPVGIALRCELLCDALRERGPLAGAELSHELDQRLGRLVAGHVRLTPLAEDLRTLLMAGWVLPLAADPERFALVNDPLDAVVRDGLG